MTNNEITSTIFNVKEAVNSVLAAVKQEYPADMKVSKELMINELRWLSCEIDTLYDRIK